MRSSLIFSLLASWCLLHCSSVAAEGSTLEDRNGDGQTEILAFGDSLTYGVGDGTEPGQLIYGIDEIGNPRGYPLRLSSLLSVPVMNSGEPGEMVIGIPGPRQPGVSRFAEVVLPSSADMVIILEGANDAAFEVSATELQAGYQKMINVARASNRSVAIATLLPPTGQHGTLTPQTTLYSQVVRQVGAMNDITVIDLERGFLTDCPDLFICPYYNLPEGLHPNTVGYDAIARMVASSLQG